MAEKVDNWEHELQQHCAAISRGVPVAQDAEQRTPEQRRGPQFFNTSDEVDVVNATAPTTSLTSWDALGAAGTNPEVGGGRVGYQSIPASPPRGEALGTTWAVAERQWGATSPRAMLEGSAGYLSATDSACRPTTTLWVHGPDHTWRDDSPLLLQKED